MNIRGRIEAIENTVGNIRANEPGLNPQWVAHWVMEAIMPESEEVKERIVARLKLLGLMGEVPIRGQMDAQGNLTVDGFLALVKETKVRRLKKGWSRANK